MEGKICPLSFSSPKDYDLCECKGEKCAWWNKESKACAVLVIANFIAISWMTIDQEVERRRKMEKP